MSDSFEFNLDFASLDEQVSYLIRTSNDEMETFLEKEGKKLKRNIVKSVPISKNNKTSSGRLKKNKDRLKHSFKTSGVVGGFYDKQFKIWSTSPHFHLVERGHRLVDAKGNFTGKYVPGRYTVKAESILFKDEYKEDLEKFVKKLKKKSEKKAKKRIKRS